MPLSTAAKDPEPVFAAVGVDDFTGRDWLVAEIDKFMTANPCGYMFIEAEAGLGKTAFAAWLVRTRGYLSHFSRYSGGRSVQPALANLSAQLITRFGLREQAPGGILPDWAQTPGGFESLLAAAAAAPERQAAVTIVVDGLDEAEVPAEGLPFGLPALLPAGVFVVGTYRTGRSPRRPDVATTTLRIAKQDLHNRRDINEYLAKAAMQERLASRLAEAGTDQAEFTRLLADRCDGVWVYLRYVLDELRLGLRQPDEIGHLPTGLRGYYADQIHRWRQEPAWDSELLPLLAVLGVAAEPLPAATLSRLAGGLDRLAVQRWCDLTLRPMLAVTPTEAPGPRLRYEIYHASFRELLSSSEDDLLASQDEGQPYELLVLAYDLRQATVAAHGRICDVYLESFGGLDAGLPVVAKNPRAASVDDGYALRHLAWHLCHAGRAADLHALLAAEHQASGSHAFNTWFAAHDHADSVADYLADIALACDDSAAATDSDLSDSYPAPAIGMELRYALINASITSLAGNISADLLGQLIGTKVWSSRRGLDHARRIADHDLWLNSVLVIHDQVKAEERPAILAEALATAVAITTDHARARALARLVPYLPADLLVRVLRATGTIADDRYRVMLLTALAPHLPEVVRSGVLALALAATSTATPGDRARELAALAPHVPAAQRHDVLALALDAALSTDDYDRAAALTRLGPHLPADLLPRALAAAVGTTGHYYRADALTGLGPHLPADLLPRALAATDGIENQAIRASALTGLAPHLPADLLPQALTAARELVYGEFCARALTGLAPHLPETERPAVLAEALAIATAVTNDHMRSQVLAALVPHLPESDRRAVLALALAAIAAVSHTGGAQPLDALAPYLPADLQAEALAIAATGSNDYRADVLIALAPHLSADLLPRALAAANAGAESARALAALAPHLPANLLAQALDAAAAITYNPFRAEALTRLAPHMPESERPAVVVQALAAATAISDGYSLVVVPTGLAAYLPDTEKATVLPQAVMAAASFSDQVHAETLPRLSQHMPASMLSWAVADAAGMTNEYRRAQALAGMAPHLPPDVLSQALTVASGIIDSHSRAQALAGLVPRLPSDLLAQARAAASATTDSSWRAEALAALAEHVPETEKSAILAEALAAAVATSHETRRARALTVVAEHMPEAEKPAILAQALAAAPGITTYGSLAWVLTEMAPHLPAALFPQALAAAASATESSRGSALAGLAPHLPAELFPEALAAVATITGESSRAWVLTKMGPYLPAGLLSQALIAATAIGADNHRIRALVGLMPYLPPDLLAQARAAAEATATSPYRRCEVLIGLAPVLPETERRAALAEALANVTVVANEISRASALAMLVPHLLADLLPGAVAIATTITSPSSRADALAALAPQLPMDLLEQALAAAPKTSPEALGAIMERAQTLLERGAPRPEYIRLLRGCLSGTARDACARVIAAAMPAIVDISGGAAVTACSQAAMDVHRWWP